MDWDKNAPLESVLFVNRLVSPSRMKGVRGTCFSSLLTCIAVCMPDIGFPLHGASVIVKTPLWPLTAFLCVTWDKKALPPFFSHCCSSRCFVSSSLSWPFSALTFKTLPLVCIVYLGGKKYHQSPNPRLQTWEEFFDKTKMKQYLLLIILFYTVDYNWSCDSRL